uniref:Lipoprotein n=1 Tax=Parastrongyloides trichosuri TaxID=131310 RepID=A0A0N4Z5Y6_PARTI
MGIIKYQRHQMLDTAIIAFTISCLGSYCAAYAISDEFLYRLFERGLFRMEEWSKFKKILSEKYKWNIFYAFFPLKVGCISNVGCIICLLIAKKSNELFLKSLRIFLISLCITALCYCFSFTYILIGDIIGLDELVYVDGFYIDTTVYFRTQDMIIIAVYPLISLAPIVISTPPVMKVWRKQIILSEKNLIRAYGIR